MTILTRVAISDRQNRHFRVGVGKFSDRAEFGRQGRLFSSAKSGTRQNRVIGEIGELARSGIRQNQGIGEIGESEKSAKSGNRKNRQNRGLGKIGEIRESVSFGGSENRDRRQNWQSGKIDDKSGICRHTRNFCRNYLSS